MERLTKEEFDKKYERFMNNYIHVATNVVDINDSYIFIEVLVNPRGRILVMKGEDRLYLGTSQDAAISAYNKALEEVENG